MARALGNYPTTVDSQGEQNNPTTASVMADTGALTPGVYEILVMASASADAQMQVEHRNAANDGVVSDTAIFYIAGGSGAEFRGRYDINTTSERFRVMMNGNLTGDAVATIFAWRVA